MKNDQLFLLLLNRCFSTLFCAGRVYPNTSQYTGIGNWREFNASFREIYFFVILTISVLETTYP